MMAKSLGRWMYLWAVGLLVCCSAVGNADFSSPSEGQLGSSSTPLANSGPQGTADANAVLGSPDLGTAAEQMGGVTSSPSGAVAEHADSNTTLLPGAAGRPLSDANWMVDSRYSYSYVGRFDLRKPAQVGFNFPGSKIGIAFTGTSLGIKLSSTGADTFDVSIDGVEYASPGDAFAIDASAPLLPCKPVTQVPAADGNNFPGCILAIPSTSPSLPTVYPIATNLQNGNHIAWIAKRSEFYQAACGSQQFFGAVLSADGKLLAPPAYRSRRLEFVGDSSLSGYGGAQRGPCSYTSRNCASGRVIPGEVAKLLNAEYVNLSSSGQGVYQSFYDHDTAHNLPIIYRQTIGLDATYPYDFSRDRVDAVVLSAGGDDLWGGGGTGEFDNNDPNDPNSARSNFVAAYIAWLTQIRAVRPQAVIFVTLTFGATGNDVTTLGSALQEAVAVRKAAGDAGVEYFSYFPISAPNHVPSVYRTLGDVTQGEKLWLGCSGHPSPGVASYFANILGGFIARRMGW